MLVFVIASVNVGGRPMQEIKAAHRKVFAGTVLCYTPHFFKPERKKVFVLLRSAFILQSGLVCWFRLGHRKSSSSYFHEAKSPKLDTFCTLQCSF